MDSFVRALFLKNQIECEIDNLAGQKRAL